MLWNLFVTTSTNLHHITVLTQIMFDINFRVTESILLNHFKTMFGIK